MKAIFRNSNELNNGSIVIPPYAVGNVSRDPSKNKTTRGRHRDDSKVAVSDASHQMRAQRCANHLMKFESGQILQKDLATQYPSEFQSWKNMKYDRTRNCGSTVHEVFQGFPGFLKNMGPKPTPAHTLERIDNQSSIYSPDNCRWATKAEQSANRKNTIVLTNNSGQSATVTEWARKTGTSGSTIRSRRSKGWNDHDCIYGRNQVAHVAYYPGVSQVAAAFDQYYSSIGNVFVTTHEIQKKLASIAKCLQEARIPIEKGMFVLLHGWNDFKGTLVRDYAEWEKRIPEVPTPQFLVSQLCAAAGYALKTLRIQALGAREDFALSQCRKDKGFRFSEGVLRKITSRSSSELDLTEVLAPWLDDSEVCLAFWSDFENTHPESAYYVKGASIPLVFFRSWLVKQLRAEMHQMMQESRAEYDRWRPND